MFVCLYVFMVLFIYLYGNFVCSFSFVMVDIKLVEFEVIEFNK